MVSKQGIFHTGGSLSAGDPSYVVRQADRECQYIISRGEMIYTLAPRQMGKTSLLKRLVSRCIAQGWSSCIIDLSTLKKLNSFRWFTQVGYQIGKACGLDKVTATLQDQVDFKNYLLTELGLGISSQSIKLALFFDEVEGLMELEFSDVFLMTLRELYQGRDQYPERLLIGFAGCIDHKDLVKNSHNSPFNVAKEIILEDFTQSECINLTLRLEQIGVPVDKQVHESIFNWTDGQPHQTQRICEVLEEWALTKRLDVISSDAVNRVIEKKFLAPHAQDTSIKHALSEVSKLLPPANSLWEKLLVEKPVHFTEPGYYALYLTGAVKHDDKGNVYVRNHIYKKAFSFGVSEHEINCDRQSRTGVSSKQRNHILTDNLEPNEKVQNSIPSTTEGKLSMDYHQGLKLLKDCIQNKSPDVLIEFSTLEDRFIKNDRDERIFGSSENTRNTRSQIIYALNEMALTHCGISFNDLCLGKNAPQSQNSTSYKQIVESLRRIENKIDRGRAEDRETAVQVLEALSQNKLDLDDANRMMSDLQTWAQKVQVSGLPLNPELRAQLDVLSTHTAGVNEYFQLAIPIVPGILSYNVELGSQHQLDLKAVWNRIKAKIKPEEKGEGIKLGAEKLYGNGNRWAVVVGVDSYEDTDHYGELHVCVKDAKAVHNQLLSSGYKPERVKMLSDETSELPTRDNVFVALNAVAKATDPDDILIFFYSGHGDEDGGESYLVARNGKRLALEDTAIKVSRIKKIMEQAQAKAKVIILDACHSGANIEGKGPTHMTEEFIRRVFEQAEGLAILASCKQGQVSYEWQTNERSVFTYYLLEALQGQADLDGKGFVTVQDANRHVSNGVKLWASQRNRNQTPTLQAEVAGDIILASKSV